MLLCFEDHAVILDQMDMLYRGGKGDIPHGVTFTGFQVFNAQQAFAQVIMQDRVLLEGVPRTKKNTTFLKPAFGHRFRHHVNIRRMVEVAVGNNDCAELLRVQFALGHLHDAAGAGVHQYLGTVKIKPETAGS